jgi:hypothetical protein
MSGVLVRILIAKYHTLEQIALPSAHPVPVGVVF